MKLSIEDLRMALQWMKENSQDVSVFIEVLPATCVLRVGTPNQEIVNITLFEADRNLNAKITKEDYLRHNLKKP